MFPTTRRSVIERLTSDEKNDRVRAFDSLTALYWKPLYKYLRVVRHRTPHDAEDLTQDFLTRMFENNALASYDPAQSSFRRFLLLLFDRHNADSARWSSRLKRGGSLPKLALHEAENEVAAEGSGHTTPEEFFTAQWVRSFFALALERFREECAANGKDQQFAIFDAYDLDGADTSSYEQLAAMFGMSVVTVTNRLAAARRRFRAIVLESLREVTASDREYRSEARALLGIEP